MPGIHETISQGLARYSIGEKLHTLRLRKSMGLVELSKHTGLSAGLLSKLERGKLFPTLPTLLRIALVHGVGLEHFFTEERKGRVSIVRKQERVRLPARPGVQDAPYHLEYLDSRATDRKLSAFVAEFEENPQEKLRPHQHDGVEFLYVMKGSLTLRIGNEEFPLDAKDAIYFDSGVQHSYRRRGSRACSAVVVTVP